MYFYIKIDNIQYDICSNWLGGKTWLKVFYGMRQYLVEKTKILAAHISKCFPPHIIVIIKIGLFG